jgi:hypothetical protein
MTLYPIMKRFRPIAVQFDSRALLMRADTKQYSQTVLNNHLKNLQSIDRELEYEYGAHGFDLKKKNFIDLGVHPFSVVAYHNEYLTQIRRSYICGDYYPALTGACSLGERILNHMIFTLRDDFKHIKIKGINSPNPESNWDKCILALSKWKVLLPEVVQHFKELKELRHESVHYNTVTDEVPAKKALLTITHIQEITRLQFGALGIQPWYFHGSDACYVKKTYEDDPFVRNYILPSCLYLSPFYRVTQVMPTWQTTDYDVKIDLEDTDENFTSLRKDSPQFHKQISKVVTS